MTTTITRRVAAAAAGGATKRVNIGSHGTDYDAWAGSWGACWGLSWHVFLVASELPNLTQRVPGSPTANTTKRVNFD